MGWRTIYVQDATKLSLNLDNLEVLYNATKYYIALEEIDNIVIEDYKTVITARLLSKICEEGISVVFTNTKKMPVGSLHSLSQNSRTSKYSKVQLNFPKEKIRLLWQQIIIIKINNQANVLDMLGKDSKYLTIYAKEVEPGDITNKEGLAARAYFRELFGTDFKRFDDDIVNYSLNFIYQIIRSKISQIIISKGFHPSFGIFHKSEYNYFNLADDLIEVYRPLCDYYVYNCLLNYKLDHLTPLFKEELLKIFYFKISIDNKIIKLGDSIPLYMNNIFNIYNNEKEELTLVPKLINE